MKLRYHNGTTDAATATMTASVVRQVFAHPEFIQIVTSGMGRFTFTLEEGRNEYEVRIRNDVTGAKETFGQGKTPRAAVKGCFYAKRFYERATGATL